MARPASAILRCALRGPPGAELARQPALLHNLRKTYGEGRAAVQALRQVDLEVRTGELLMLVGPSGCGKTTLISIIAGILDQSDGDCFVFEHDFKKMPAHERTRYRGQNV